MIFVKRRRKEVCMSEFEDVLGWDVNCERVVMYESVMCDAWCDVMCVVIEWWINDKGAL
jgi:hypothetical protein